MGAVELLLVRHGESAANVAATEAMADGAETIAVPARDADVLLSPAGEEQAQALGRFLRQLVPETAPQSLWVSPYVRAQETARIALASTQLALQPRVDERLRDRELGVVDALTALGVRNRLPLEHARRQWLGKFYYRPPGGEAWTDVALRMRSLLADLDREEDGKRVLLVCHDAVIMVLRYVCERLSEADLLQIAVSTQVLNASVTRLVRPSGTGNWTLDVFNEASHLEQQDVPVTANPGDTSVLPR